MEGTLRHLVRVRKGRRMAGGLITSLFHQLLAGVRHIHTAGIVHGALEPSHILVTTTGMSDYISEAKPGTVEKDIVAVIKIGGFSSASDAHEAPQQPSYLRYSAPERVLIPDGVSIYSDYTPADMWAVGTVVAEIITLRPLFPGVYRTDMLEQFMGILGDPRCDYPGWHRLIGGSWKEGVRIIPEWMGDMTSGQVKQLVFAFLSLTLPCQRTSCMTLSW